MSPVKQKGNDHIYIIKDTKDMIIMSGVEPFV